MSIVTAIIIKYGSKILTGAFILTIRYLEKTSVIKHYKKKFDELLNNDSEFPNGEKTK